MDRTTLDGRAPTRTGTHLALVHSGPDELTASASAFLRAGATEGAPTVAVVTAGTRTRLEEALGADAAAVRWADPARWYTFPAQALRRIAEFAADADGSSPRLLGECVWAGRTALERQEWARYESLLNVACPGLAVVCAYDGRVTDADVVRAVARTHPLLGGRANPDFVDAARFVGDGDADPLPPPVEPVALLRLGAGSLRSVRAFAAARAGEAGLGPDRVDDVVLAVNEAVSNAVEHGGGGVLRSWRSEHRLVFEVTSPSAGVWHPFAGYLPPDPRGIRGRGLWLMRQLTDLVELRRDRDGATARLHLWLDRD